jgi:hypothetical protein
MAGGISTCRPIQFSLPEGWSTRHAAGNLALIESSFGAMRFRRLLRK